MDGCLIALRISSVQNPEYCGVIFLLINMAYLIGASIKFPFFRIIKLHVICFRFNMINLN